MISIGSADDTLEMKDDKMNASNAHKVVDQDAANAIGSIEND